MVAGQQEKEFSTKMVSVKYDLNLCSLSLSKLKSFKKYLFTIFLVFMKGANSSQVKFNLKEVWTGQISI